MPTLMPRISAHKEQDPESAWSDKDLLKFKTQMSLEDKTQTDPVVTDDSTSLPSPAPTKMIIATPPPFSWVKASTPALPANSFAFRPTIPQDPYASNPHARPPPGPANREPAFLSEKRFQAKKTSEVKPAAPAPPKHKGPICASKNRKIGALLASIEGSGGVGNASDGLSNTVMSMTSWQSEVEDLKKKLEEVHAVSAKLEEKNKENVAKISDLEATIDGLQEIIAGHPTQMAVLKQDRDHSYEVLNPALNGALDDIGNSHD